MFIYMSPVEQIQEFLIDINLGVSWTIGSQVYKCSNQGTMPNISQSHCAGLHSHQQRWKVLWIFILLNHLIFSNFLIRGQPNGFKGILNVTSICIPIITKGNN